MASRGAAACAIRSRAPEVHRVSSDNVALQEEAKSVRERRLALEEVMRQERARRLQAAASRTTATANTSHSSGCAAPPREQQKGEAVDSNRAPQTLEEYRRELDKDCRNKELLRLHYYTSGHLNPADVHFYTVKSRVKEYQRRAPSPPPSERARRLLLPTRKAHLETEMTQPSTRALETISVLEGTSEQWTKSALLRMQANQHVLRRIEERERKEAAHIGRPIVRGTTAPAGRLSALPQPYNAPVTTSAMASRPVHVAEAAVSACDAPRFLAVDRSYTATAPTWRWSPLRQRSPRKTYLTTSPLRLRGRAASPAAAQSDSLFKTSLIDGSSTPLHMSRTVSFPPTSAGHNGRATCSWRPLEYSGTAHLEGRRSWPAYKPIAEQLPSAPSESPGTWAELTQSRSHPRQGLTAPSPPPRDYSARETGEGAPSVPTIGPPITKPKPTLLNGFRMPDTVLKREDLFQGFI
ncbi:conserved hypothetical protein [Leishmania infantum JPCM5]|uniref:Uncharacterized protein n=2 Tax=Leishmania infantum TaxID=5671 RepID=A4IAI5_LEIIN|nr:conserved hypothetical protein [Leishmania infantum JPCM5]CAC9541623.1 hypothetical_protein_-_conserved [Leishmania infantum]CAM71842.1 conserved hypothetical protein [Leishmania infantum JPCM5]SUZ45797.1 hypothetical_protein_-_conserved [Leishmania infantum]|eukprot:XP_001468754.1 conserved hypothetical protein [Leishmania infantum JPCM5]